MDGVVDAVVRFLSLDPEVWLAPNITWEQLRDESGGRLKPQLWHYQYVFLFAIAAMLGRALLDRILFLPLGRLLKVSETVPPPPPANSAAEKLHESTKRPSRQQIEDLAKENSWSERKVKKWLHRRRAANERSKMPKFQEACWRFLGYTFLLGFGYWSLKDTKYFSNTYECWTNYPDETMPERVFWYYMLELAFYTALTCSHFFDTRRKDFWEMLVHHIVTLTLICTSFSIKHVAIGSLVMFVHDLADPWLEITKALSYTRSQSAVGKGRSMAQVLVDILFAVFALVFWITRLYVFPRFLIYSTWVESDMSIGYWTYKYIFTSLLTLLFVLHVFWSYLILLVVTKAFRVGQVGQDSRSDDEEDDDFPDTPLGDQPSRPGSPLTPASPRSSSPSGNEQKVEESTNTSEYSLRHR